MAGMTHCSRTSASSQLVIEKLVVAKCQLASKKENGLEF